jgi:hypothetical protein
VARILIVGGGCPGRRLAELIVERGHAVRITTRSERRRAAIEASGAECWIGTPDRLATMRGALENVTIACWLLAGAHGEHEQLRALHGSRLEYFLTQAIDTTVRGFVYDATPRPLATAGGDALGGGGDMAGRGDAADDEGVAPPLLAEGAEIVRRLTALNAIPAAVLGDDDASFASDAWVERAACAIDALLAGRA